MHLRGRGRVERNEFLVEGDTTVGRTSQGGCRTEPHVRDHEDTPAADGGSGVKGQKQRAMVTNATAFVKSEEPVHCTWRSAREGLRGLDPLFGSGPIPSRLAGVDCPRAFDEQQCTVNFRRRSVLQSRRHNKHVTMGECPAPVAEIDSHRSCKNEEHLVGVRVLVPDELSLDLDHFELR